MKNTAMTATYHNVTINVDFAKMLLKTFNISLAAVW